jgi:hypothetical protein
MKSSPALEELSRPRLISAVCAIHGGAEGPRPDASPPRGEPAEQIDMIEQGLAKTGSALVIVLGDVPHDLGQIA